MRRARLWGALTWCALATGCPDPTPPPCVEPVSTLCVDSCCNAVTSVGCGAPCPRGTTPAEFCEPDDRCMCPAHLCHDPCCDVVAGSCDGVCPPGARDFSPSCEPTPECPFFDAGPEDAGPEDAGPDAGDAGDDPDAGCPEPGPMLRCYADGDTCCTRPALRAEMSGECDLTCPAGYSLGAECRPDAICEDVRACEDNGDCVVTHAGCCEPCTTPELRDVVALASAGVGPYREMECADPVACPDCEPAPPNPRLVATCNVNRCEAFDVHDTLMTRCSSDDECRLRVRGCCECGGDLRPEALVALRRDAESDYVTLICNASEGCDACVPTYPDTVEAFCNPTGRCDVRAR